MGGGGSAAGDGLDSRSSGRSPGDKISVNSPSHLGHVRPPLALSHSFWH